MRAAWWLQASTIGALPLVGLLGCPSSGSGVSLPEGGDDASNPPPLAPADVQDRSEQ